MKIESLKILKASLFEGKKVCIVGNYGVTDADNEAIEGSDCVIRFNNYATRTGIAMPRHRDRCDVLFSTFDLHSRGANPDHVVIGVPFPFHAKRIIEKSQEWYPTSRLHTINPYTNFLMCEEMNVFSEGWKHPFPSIGFTALWHLHRMKIPFHLCGFGWYYDMNTQLFQGYECGKRSYPTHHNHCYPKEVEWIVKHIYHNPEYSVSKQCAHILIEASKQIQRNQI